jgi:hypothetical protein
MDLVLVLIALCAVLLAVRMVRARRRRGPHSRDTGSMSNDPPGRAGGDVLRPADARGAVNRHSWMAGGGGVGGGG